MKTRTSGQRSTTRPTIDRRTYLTASGGLTACIVGFAGCLSRESGTGTLATEVTDQPGEIADFESCVVSIVGVWLGPTGAESGEEGEREPSDREYHRYDEPQAADLVELQDGQTKLIDERELDAGEFEFLQLDVDEVDATLDDGEPAEVDVPGEAPLTFDEPFEVREGGTTTFVADFTPVSRGQTGEYVLQPVADGVEVGYEDGAES